MLQTKVEAPLTDSYNDIFLVSFTAFRRLDTLSDQEHVFKTAVCLSLSLVKDYQCVYVNIMRCVSHTHAVLAVRENSIRVGGCAVAVCLMEPQSDTTL